MPPKNAFNDETLGSIKELPKTEVKEPKMYKVVMFNDDYTTKDFVVDVLVAVFHKTVIEATKIMMDVHKTGKGICGVYTYDISLTKVRQVQYLAKQAGYPFRCEVEEA